MADNTVNMRKSMRKMFKWVLCVFVFLSVAIIFKLFIFSPFRITSNSMSPMLKKGDIVIVNKLIYGIRSSKVVKVEGHTLRSYNRTRGLGRINHDDVIVFNYPYKEWDRWDEICFQPNKYYVKRCIALPGDSLTIINGEYIIKGNKGQLKGGYSQEVFYNANRHQHNLPDTVIPYSPHNKLWTVYNMGPIYIPKRGDVVQLDSVNSVIYRNIIEWEIANASHGKQQCNEHKEHTFTNNYYFMAGENVRESVDSRFWGLLPECFIIGKVSFTL